jgi:hypothetical protein
MIQCSTLSCQGQAFSYFINVSCDRGAEYIRAASTDAPQAIQDQLSSDTLDECAYLENSQTNRHEMTTHTTP